MWRWIKYGFLALVALALLTIALANRQPVELTLLHSGIDAFAGFNHSLTLPLYVVIFGSVALGLLLGFVWEWLREAKHRSEASQKRSEARQLKREVERMKTKKAKDEGQDEVLALLEDTGTAR